MVCGDESYICSSDMTFIDVSFGYMKTCFQTCSEQNLSYTFIRPEAGESNTGFHFMEGENPRRTGARCFGPRGAKRGPHGLAYREHDCPRPYGPPFPVFSPPVPFL